MGLTHRVFAENGTEYDQLAILNADYTVNATKLEEVGLPFYAGTQVIFAASRTMYIGGKLSNAARFRLVMSERNDLTA